MNKVCNTCGYTYHYCKYSLEIKKVGLKKYECLVCSIEKDPNGIFNFYYESRNGKLIKMDQLYIQEINEELKENRLIKER